MSIKKFKMVLWVVCVFVTQQFADVRAQTIAQEFLSESELEFEKFTKRITNRALVGGLYQDGRDTLLYHGRINLFGKKPSENDLFQIGSVTKTFTGHLLAQELVTKQIGLDDRLSDYLSIRKKARYQNTTLLSMATHTSGLPHNTLTVHLPTLASYVGLVIGMKHFILRPLDAPAWMIDLPWSILVIPPPVPYFSLYGEKMVNFDLNTYGLKQKKIGQWKYSNLGVGLLGRVLSIKNQMSYEELLQKRICKPLGLENTTTTPTKEQKRNIVTPHNILGFRTLRTHMRKGGIEAAGGIRSSGKDMMKYLSVQIEGRHTKDSLVYATQQKTYFVSEEEKRKGLEMGLTWIKYNPSGKAESTIIWHSGQIAGSSAFIGFIPEKNIGLFILSNNGKSKKITYMGFRLLRKALASLEKSK